MNSAFVFTRFGFEGEISNDEFEKLRFGIVFGILDTFESLVLRNLINLLWLLRIEEGLLYKGDLPIFDIHCR